APHHVVSPRPPQKVRRRLATYISAAPVLSQPVPFKGLVRGGHGRCVTMLVHLLVPHMCESAYAVQFCCLPFTPNPNTIRRIPILFRNVLKESCHAHASPQSARDFCRSNFHHARRLPLVLSISFCKALD